jgi:putative nucleotidyltransferase with HDIG domain
MVGFWKRLTLLQRYTLVSAALAVGLTVLLSVVTVRAIESVAIRDEASVAAELVLRTIAPELQPDDFTGTLRADRRTLLDALFHAHGISDRALRIRLWRADGRLLYSNIQEPTVPVVAGADFKTPDGFEMFLKNRRQVESATPGVVRFFVPVQVEGNSKPLAAFEIFYDLAPLRQQLGHIRRTVWTAVPLGMLVLYVSVYALISTASRRLLSQQADLVVAHLGTYQSLASAIDAKDSHMADHSTNVADLAVRVARALGLRATEIDEVRITARLHDVGKIGVPDAILMKPGPLNEEEQEQMRTHAVGGYEILRSAPLPDDVKLSVRHSHERWDGTGYPDGLASEAIPLYARIVAVVDAYDAMTNDRPYRKALPVDEAFRRLEREAGGQFDPRVVRLFIWLMRDAGKFETRSSAALSR